MNTPSHVIVNLAFLGKKKVPSGNIAIALGALLPDLPMPIMYIWEHFVQNVPTETIFSYTYFHAPWQPIVDAFHSIPLALLGMLAAITFGWYRLRLFFISMAMHSLLDIPVHTDDAHSHFFPLSDYRFNAHLSYWNVNEGSLMVSLIELVLVLVASYFVLKKLKTAPAKGAVIAVNALYASAYIIRFLY